MAQRPGVLLVHGAWHGGWCWDAVLPHLADAGLEAATVDLASAGGGGDLAADAAVVRAALDARQGPTVVVGHSYGGIVISEATAGRDDVSHLVYLCAFMLDTGESLLGALAGPPPDWFAVDEAAGVSRVTDPVRAFYLDVDPAVAAGASERLVPQSLSSFAAPQSGAGWRGIPSTYVTCTQDQAIPYPAQQAMSGRAGAVHTLQASHSPFLSQPGQVAARIAAVAG